MAILSEPAVDVRSAVNDIAAFGHRCHSLPTCSTVLCLLQCYSVHPWSSSSFLHFVMSAFLRSFLNAVICLLNCLTLGLVLVTD